MKKIILSVIFGALIFSSLNADDVVLQNDGILSDKIVDELNLLGNELLEKTGVFVGIATVETLNGKNLKEKADELSKKITYNSYAFILLTKEEHLVEIYQSDDVKKDFDKEVVLSPFPNRGSILPILTSRKGKDLYNAAMLNGYADVVERIASSRGVELENALGNSNRNVINLIRFLVYGSIVLVIGAGFYYRYKDKKDGS